MISAVWLPNNWCRWRAALPQALEKEGMYPDLTWKEICGIRRAKWGLSWSIRMSLERRKRWRRCPRGARCVRERISGSWECRNFAMWKYGWKDWEGTRQRNINNLSFRKRKKILEDKKKNESWESWGLRIESYDMQYIVIITPNSQTSSTLK